MQEMLFSTFTMTMGNQTSKNNSNDNNTANKITTSEKSTSSASGSGINETKLENIDYRNKLIEIPTYTLMSRCKLFKLIWSGKWSAALERCKSHPNETCAYNQSRRTALHLVMFATSKEENKGQIDAMLSIVQSNPHAILLRDKQGYTPMHLACQFHSKNHTIISLLSDITLQVEHSLVCNNSDEKRCGICYYLRKNGNGYNYTLCPCECNNNEIHIGKKDKFNSNTSYGDGFLSEVTTSPFSIACRKITTPIQVLDVLLNASIIHTNQLRIKYKELLSIDLIHGCNCEYVNEISSWIAPTTGGETTTYYYEYTACTTDSHHYNTLTLSDVQVDISQKRSINTYAKPIGILVLKTSTPLEVIWDRFVISSRTIKYNGSYIDLNSPNASLLELFRNITIKYLNYLKTTTASYTNNNDNNNKAYLFDQNALNENNTNDDLYQHESELITMIYEWIKILLILVKTSTTPSSFLFLHTIVSLKKPIPSLVSFALHLVPNDTLTKNARGYIPLHLALLSYNKYDMNYDTTHDQSLHASENNIINHGTADVTATSNHIMELMESHEKKQLDIILLLIKACPSSTTTPIDIILINKNMSIHDDDNTGRRKFQQYPLSMAIIKGIEWDGNDLVLKEIMSSTITSVDPESNENIVYTKDELHSLHMFMLAAVFDYNSINTVYVLLRMFPEVLAFQ